MSRRGWGCPLARARLHETFTTRSLSRDLARPILPRQGIPAHKKHQRGATGGHKPDAPARVGLASRAIPSLALRACRDWGPNMKAAICYEFGAPLVVEDVEVDPPQQGEVKVAISACAICHSDLTWIQGKWGGHTPLVAGHEAAGVVAEVGPGVGGVRPGDRVVVYLRRSCGRCHFCARGRPYHCEGQVALDRETRLHNRKGQPLVQGLRTAAFAEYAVVDQSQVVAVSADLPLDRACLLACGV